MWVVVTRLEILGLPSLSTAGQYLYEEVCSSCPELEVAFVWNRSAEKMRGAVPDELVLTNLSDVASR